MDVYHAVRVCYLSKAGRTLEDETGRDQDGTVSARPRS